MPNPPYSGGVIIIKENQDGLDVRVTHWDDVPAGTPIPPSHAGLEHTMFMAQPAPSVTIERMPATRSALKTAFAQYVDTKFPDTPA